MNIASLLIEDERHDGSHHGLVGLGTDYYEHAIVLSGGGIDSFMSTIAYTNIREVKKLTFLVINYGQQSYKAERFMTSLQYKYFIDNGFDCDVVEIDDSLMQHIRNPLADRAKQKKKAENYAQNDDYVPNRNARFLFTAAGLAETIKAGTIILGAVGNVNQDNSYAFLHAAYETIKNSNRDVIPQLYAPFVLLTKSMVAHYAEEQGLERDVAYLTTSCFDASEVIQEPEDADHQTYFVTQCGKCRSCASLKQAFKFAGVTDHFIYEEEVA